MIYNCESEISKKIFEFPQIIQSIKYFLKNFISNNIENDLYHVNQNADFTLILLNIKIRSLKIMIYLLKMLLSNSIDDNSDFLKYTCFLESEPINVTLLVFNTFCKFINEKETSDMKDYSVVEIYN